MASRILSNGTFIKTCGHLASPAKEQQCKKKDKSKHPARIIIKNYIKSFDAFWLGTLSVDIYWSLMGSNNWTKLFRDEAAGNPLHWIQVARTGHLQDPSKICFLVDVWYIYIYDVFMSIIIGDIYFLIYLSNLCVVIRWGGFNILYKRKQGRKTQKAHTI